MLGLETLLVMDGLNWETVAWLPGVMCGLKFSCYRLEVNDFRCSDTTTDVSFLQLEHVPQIRKVPSPRDLHRS
jgi:hypothetical protein